jgi:chemosensory pili system protein ChpA (sensor histidine kinase/response regulator)
MSKKVLMVDDQPFILTMGQEILERHGFTVVTAKNGEEAINLAKTLLPDVILLDIEMPKMNGFEACRLIRQEEKTKNIPIIMLTSKTEAAYMEKGFQAGANLYIGKPFSEEKLMTVVKVVMSKTK